MWVSKMKWMAMKNKTWKRPPCRIYKQLWSKCCWDLIREWWAIWKLILLIRLEHVYSLSSVIDNCWLLLSPWVRLSFALYILCSFCRSLWQGTELTGIDLKRVDEWYMNVCQEWNRLKGDENILIITYTVTFSNQTFATFSLGGYWPSG